MSTRNTSKVIAKTLVIILIPALLIGTFATLFSITSFAILIMGPVFGAGLYLYLGYIKISSDKASPKQAQKTWSWSAIYNGILMTLGLVSTLIEGFDEMWPVFIIAMGQATVMAASIYAKKHVVTDSDYEATISQIGIAQS